MTYLFRCLASTLAAAILIGMALSFPYLTDHYDFGGGMHG